MEYKNSSYLIYCCGFCENALLRLLVLVWFNVFRGVGPFVYLNAFPFHDNANAKPEAIERKYE